jgi:flagellar biosynthesis protein FlhF
MNIRTFRASSMREALDLVRRELGGDAIILSTRQLRLRRRFPWQRARHEAEIVAGMAEQTVPLRHTAERLGRDASSHEHNRDTSSSGIDAGLDLSSHPVAVHLASHSKAAAPVDCVDGPVPPTPDSAAPPSLDDGGLSQRLETIESLVAQLNADSRRGGREEVPDELFHLYAELIDADVDDQEARGLVLDLRRQCSAEDLKDPLRVSTLLAGLVEKQVPCSGPICVTPGRRTVVALVGPTGVGKTTTIAKLAANFKLRDGVKVGLVTVDTYRVAAVEQLRTYAEIIDLPMHVVTSPREMRRALEELAGMDLVLIDTAGRSPRDELKIQELRSFLAEAGVDQVHLVLSLVASARALEKTAEKFRTVGVTSLLLTKLDEAPGVGAVLSAANRIKLPISYFTTGQDVPDDIEAASPARAVRLILGQEDLFRRRPAA